MKNNVTDIVDCFGCGVCQSICPKKAISFHYNNEGFFEPIVEEQICVNCGICLSKCIAKKDLNRKEPINRYVYQLKDEKMLLKSASGGFFYGVAKYVIENGGYVVGCVMNESFEAKHILSNSLDDLKLMQGSKYIQSHVSDKIYKQIYENLVDGKLVLFSGTPCQVEALLLFLGKEYDNLITIDLICHGVASPGLFKNYILNYKLSKNEVIEKVLFRSKEHNKYPKNHSLAIYTNLRIIDKKNYYDKFEMSFYHNRILRETCYKCKYSCSKRVSDITIGDFDKAKMLKMRFNSKNGFSTILVNSVKGEFFLSKINDLFDYCPIDFNYSQINLVQPTIRPKKRDKLKKMNFNELNPSEKSTYKMHIYFSDFCKRFIPNNIKKKIKLIIRKK